MNELRAARIKRRLTLDALAEKCEAAGVRVSATHLGRIERGIHKPTPRLRKAIADALEVRLESVPRHTRVSLVQGSLEIRDRRDQLGMTLVQLSEECRKHGVTVHHSALSRIERGTNAPRPELWRVLVDILGFDPNDAPIPHAASREGPGKILQPASPEWLEEHYTLKGWTVSQIAQEIGRSTGYTWELLRNSGIRMRKSGYRQSSSEMRKARLAKGMKASTLAELCGVSESTVSRIERGVIGAYESLREDLARHLGISIDQIPKSPYKKKKPRRGEIYAGERLRAGPGELSRHSDQRHTEKG